MLNFNYLCHSNSFTVLTVYTSKSVFLTLSSVDQYRHFYSVEFNSRRVESTLPNLLYRHKIVIDHFTFNEESESLDDAQSGFDPFYNTSTRAVKTTWWKTSCWTDGIVWHTNETDLLWAHGVTCPWAGEHSMTVCHFNDHLLKNTKTKRVWNEDQIASCKICKEEQLFLIWEFVLSSHNSKVVGQNLKCDLTYNFAGKLQVDFLKDGES